jgi:hypothetical protein
MICLREGIKRFNMTIEKLPQHMTRKLHEAGNASGPIRPPHWSYAKKSPCYLRYLQLALSLLFGSKPGTDFARSTLTAV